MRRGTGSGKARRRTKPPAARKSSEDDRSGGRDLAKRLAEALDQQTATAEILRVISRSPGDLQPVLDAVAENAARLCNARDVIILRADGDVLRMAASVGSLAVPVGTDLRSDFRFPLTRGSVSGRAVVDRTTLHVRDLAAEPDAEFPTGKDLQRRFGHRTMLAAPLLRDDAALGVICVFRTEVRPFSDSQIALLETFADQAVIAIENVRLFTELETRNRALAEALERETATSEILRVISSSPTDIQPVLDAVATSAARLCSAHDAIIFRLDGDVLRRAAHTGPILAPPGFVIPATHGRVTGRAVLDRQPVHVVDAQAASDEFPETRVFAREHGFRTILSVPLLREGAAIGTIDLRRSEVKPFTETQIDLLRTFADQSVIAIENVRLFTELQAKNVALTAAHARVTEALEQQTATSEILRVISQSPTDAQPVFAAVAVRAARLCEAFDAAIHRIDGEVLRMVAHDGPIQPDAVLPLAPGTLAGRVVREQKARQVADMQAEARTYPISSEFARNRGFRTILAVPLVCGDGAVGTITIRRTEVRPFSDRQVELLKTFADQAVIAIENVHLFKELQASNKDLKEALEQQTATSEILGVIARSPTDVQPVLETLVENAVTLGGADRGVIFRWDGDAFKLAANYGHSPEFVEFVTRHPPSLGRGSAVGRAALERRTVHIHDVFADPDYERPARSVAEGYRTVLGIPMLRGDECLGLFALHRHEVRPFTERQIKLMETFADQAVIAIENVRLFTELQARTQELSRSVGQLTALGEVGRAVSSTLDLETVLTTIVSRAVQLAGLEAGAIYEYDEAAEVFHLRATENLPEAFLEIARPLALPKGEGATGRLAVTREPVQIPDIAAAGAYHGRLRDVLLGLGHRALLAVPLVSEDHIVGGLVVNRRQPGEFPAEVIELLRTFATQSALAIQNAQLFREIEDKSRQLEVASRHKSEFLANMSHELRTPLNAIIGFAEVLTERMFGELNEKQDEYLKDIHTSGQHLLSLINDILDLSKVEAGRMELEVTDVDLAAAIDNALTLVRERAGRRGIALHQAVDRRVGQVRGDERKIKQVLLNLLSNALKFTPEGGRVDVRASVIDGRAEISVTDTGVGVAPEDQEAVFEEFRQVGTADKKVEGTGLGLALSRKFIELHGGRIWLTSQPGQGSTFTFTLPCP